MATPSLQVVDLRAHNADQRRTNTLLEGPVNTGKTWITRTLLREWPDASGVIHPGCGKEVLTVSLEPGWEDTNNDLSCNMGMHLVYIPPLDIDWETLGDITRAVQRAGDVTKVIDSNKMDYTQLLDTYSALSKYTCQRCGREFGSASNLDSSYAVVMDGLTGLSRNSMMAATGLKPHKSWPEYDAAGQLVENLLRKCVSIPASFILIAHVDRELDPVTNTVKLTMHTIGNKLAPRLTKDLFSEIIYTWRDDKDRFWWSTKEPNMDLKARRLGFNDKIDPDFQKILGEAQP